MASMTVVEHDLQEPGTGRYEVFFHLWAAGGRLWPTSTVVSAESSEEAIAAAERAQRSRDFQARRSYRGYFEQAHAVPA